MNNCNYSYSHFAPVPLVARSPRSPRTLISVPVLHQNRPHPSSDNGGDFVIKLFIFAVMQSKVMYFFNIIFHQAHDSASIISWVWPLVSPLMATFPVSPHGCSKHHVTWRRSQSTSTSVWKRLPKLGTQTELMCLTFTRRSGYMEQPISDESETHIAGNI